MPVPAKTPPPGMARVIARLEPVMDLMRRHDLLSTVVSRADRVARLRFGRGRLGRRIALTTPGTAGGQRKVESMIASRVRQTMASSQRRSGP